MSVNGRTTSNIRAPIDYQSGSEAHSIIIWCDLMLQLGFSQVIFFNTDKKKKKFSQKQEATFKSDPLFFFFPFRFDQIFKVFMDRKPIKNIPLSYGPESGAKKVSHSLNAESFVGLLKPILQTFINRNQLLGKPAPQKQKLVLRGTAQPCPSPTGQNWIEHLSLPSLLTQQFSERKWQQVLSHSPKLKAVLRNKLKWVFQ